MESVETITRNVVLNGTEYRNYQKSFALAVTDVTSEDSPVIGMFGKNKTNPFYIKSFVHFIFMYNHVSQYF